MTLLTENDLRNKLLKLRHQIMNHSVCYGKVNNLVTMSGDYIKSPFGNSTQSLVIIHNCQLITITITYIYVRNTLLEYGNLQRRQTI
jgi:hypothetical protein